MERDEGTGPNKLSVPDILEEMQNTYVTRNAIYRDNYKRIGELCLILFPEGIELNTVEDYNRFFCLFQVIGKLTRYTFNFVEPHKDSMHDLAVYAAMLLELDQDVRDAPFP